MIVWQRLDVRREFVWSRGQMRLMSLTVAEIRWESGSKQRLREGRYNMT